MTKPTKNRRVALAAAESKRTLESREEDRDYSLTKAQLAELRRRVEEMKDPTRYMVRSGFPGSSRFELFYNVEDGCFAMDIQYGTAFKYRKDAEAVLRALGPRENHEILIVKRRGDKLHRVRAKTGA